MALQTSFPGPSGVVDSLMLRKDVNGQVVRNQLGTARMGLLLGGPSPVVTATATMNVSVGAFVAVLERSGTLWIANDGAVNVAIGAAPASNSRIDLVTVYQNENGYGGFADGSNTPAFKVIPGVAAASPTPPATPANHLLLATVQVPSTATATNSAGVIITPAYQYTALAGGVIPFKTDTQREAWDAPAGQLAVMIDTGEIWVRTGTSWSRAPSKLTKTPIALQAGLWTASDPPIVAGVQGGYLVVEGGFHNTSGGSFGTSEAPVSSTNLPVAMRPDKTWLVPGTMGISGQPWQACNLVIFPDGHITVNPAVGSGSVGPAGLRFMFSFRVPLVAGP